MCLISATIAVEEGTAGPAARVPISIATATAGPGDRWGALIRRPARGDDGRGHGAGADEGHKDVEASAGLQRWVRGGAGPWPRDHRRSELRQRLTRLLDVLLKVVGNGVVTSEKRIDPAQDFAWWPGSAQPRPAPRPGRRLGEVLLNEKVPASLAADRGRPHEAGGGRTWRRCCGSSSTRPASGRRRKDWHRDRLATRATRHAK